MTSFKHLSDANLICQYQTSKNALLFGELYNRYYSKVYHYCLGKTKNRDAAFDITQDVFVKVALKIDKLRHAVTFVAWLFRIAHNNCINHLKAAKKNNTLNIENQLNLKYTDFDVEEVINKEHQLLEFCNMFENELDETSRNLLAAKYIDQLSIEELSQQYQLSISAVKMRLLRGRKKAVASFQKKHLPSAS